MPKAVTAIDEQSRDLDGMIKHKRSNSTVVELGLKKAERFEFTADSARFGGNRQQSKDANWRNSLFNRL